MASISDTLDSFLKQAKPRLERVRTFIESLDDLEAACTTFIDMKDEAMVYLDAVGEADKDEKEGAYEELNAALDGLKGALDNLAHEVSM